MRSTTLNFAPRVLASALVVVLLLGAGWSTQSDVVAAPLTKEQGDAILEELRLIRQVLEKTQHQERIYRHWQGTPTFIVGRTTDDVVEGVKLRGVQSMKTIRGYIDALLETPDKPSG